MAIPEMYSMQSDDADFDLGVVYAASPDILRRYGEAYMRDPKTKGSLEICDPDGQPIAAYDIWHSCWIEQPQTGG